MPTRNSRKEYAPKAYYHVYTRGVNKQAVFLDEQDYHVLLGYLQRYLSMTPPKKQNGQKIRSFADDISLLSYCLMTNHIHLQVYQHNDERALAGLLQRVFTSYSMYFNKKYHRVGPLFQSRYLASRIDSDAYLYHISRYIHRNPVEWRNYNYSSLRYYTGEAHADWVKPAMVLGLFNNSVAKYLDFLADIDDIGEDPYFDHLAHS